MQWVLLYLSVVMTGVIEHISHNMAKINDNWIGHCNTLKCFQAHVDRYMWNLPRISVKACIDEGSR
jgi:hypothetical protein